MWVARLLSLVAAALPLASAGCLERVLEFRVHRLTGVRVTRIDGAGFDLRVSCELENPNRVGAQLSDVRFETRLGDHLLGRGRLERPLAVAPQSRFALDAPVHVAYRDLPPDLPQRAAGGELELVTQVTFRAHTALGTYPMTLRSAGRTRIAEALQVAVQGSFQGHAVRVENIALSRVGLGGLTLRLRLVLRNLFAFPVQIRSGAFELEVNGVRFGSSTLPRPLRFAPRGVERLTMDVAASHGAVGSAVVGMLGSDPQFRVRGTLQIEPIGGVSRIPLDVRADSSIFSQ